MHACYACILRMQIVHAYRAFILCMHSMHACMLCMHTMHVCMHIMHIVHAYYAYYSCMHACRQAGMHIMHACMHACMAVANFCLTSLPRLSQNAPLELLGVDSRVPPAFCKSARSSSNYSGSSNLAEVGPENTRCFFYVQLLLFSFVPKDFETNTVDEFRLRMWSEYHYYRCRTKSSQHLCMHACMHS